MQMVEEYQDDRPTSYSFLPWLVCFSASLFFFYEFIQGNMFASIADNIMHDFHVQADKMAYLSSIYYLSNVLFLFVAGMLLDRFSAKKTNSGCHVSLCYQYIYTRSCTIILFSTLLSVCYWYWQRFLLFRYQFALPHDGFLQSAWH